MSIPDFFYSNTGKDANFHITGPFIMQSMRWVKKKTEEYVILYSKKKKKKNQNYSVKKIDLI